MVRACGLKVSCKKPYISMQQTNQSSTAISTLNSAVEKVACSLGYANLKQKQRESILEFIKGNDVFVSLPTGFGKSLCYILLPRVFDEMRGVNKKSIILVVSPLLALMKDQVASTTALGISSIHISDKETNNISKKRALSAGEYQIIFVSPEALFRGTELRRLVCSDVYMANLVAFVVDEAHCVTKWGDTFRVDFSNLGEYRSIVPKGVRVMALTATASVSTRRSIIKSLNMQKPAIVYIAPEKENIIYLVGDKPKEGIPIAFEPITKRLIQDRKMGRIIIFCKTYEDVINIHQYFMRALGEYYTEPKGAPNYVINRVVDVYTHCTHPTIKTKILQQFTTSSCLRIVIATIAFGMGIDCSDVRQIIHWGVPSDAEMYVQESGRAGRDGQLSCALILKNSRDLDRRYTSQHMIDYCINTSSCRRQILYKDFPECEFSPKGCLCCDICGELCVCGQCSMNLQSFTLPKSETK